VIGQDKKSEAKFTVTISGPFASSYREYIRKMIVKARRSIRSRLRELSVVLVGPKEMSRLHKHFMGIKGPTDVLTFDLDEGREGEVVICVPVARKRAKARGIPVREEVLLYAIHGMLHLSGWDDKSSAGFEAMHRKEDQILRRLGVGTIFARPERQRRRKRARGKQT